MPNDKIQWGIANERLENATFAIEKGQIVKIISSWERKVNQQTLILIKVGLNEMITDKELITMIER